MPNSVLPRETTGGGAPRLRARLTAGLVGCLALPLAVLTARLRRLPAQSRRLVWGPVPILNNKYWSQAVQRLGRASVTCMESYYERINQRADFDVYFDDLVPSWVPRRLRRHLAPYAALAMWLREGVVVHIPYSGGPLGRTWFWRLEAPLFRAFSIRTVVLAYGADFYRYAAVDDPSLRHALLLSYPQAARQQSRIAMHVEYWERHGDVLIPGMCIDGAARWDVLTPQAVCIDESAWPARATYTDHDGINGTVRVAHAPNHRGFKGTEFVIEAVQNLREEGLHIDLVLLENLQNSQVREVLASVDVLVEQLLFTGYALNAEEGMSTGLPVVANVGDSARTLLFRRYSFLAECPVVPATIEDITDVLRTLVRSPELRRDRGRAGRRYIEERHSLAAASAMFDAIYRRLLDGEDIDLPRLFDPHAAAHHVASGRS